MRNRKAGPVMLMYDRNQFRYYDEIENIWVDNLKGELLREKYRKYCFDLIIHTLNNFSMDEKIDKEDLDYIQGFSEKFICLTNKFKNEQISRMEFKKQTRQLIKEAHNNLDKYSGLQNKLLKLTFVVGSLLSFGMLNIYSRFKYGSFFPSFAPSGTFENELINLDEDVDQAIRADNWYKPSP